MRITKEERLAKLRAKYFNLSPEEKQKKIAYELTKYRERKERCGPKFECICGRMANPINIPSHNSSQHHQRYLKEDAIEKAHIKEMSKVITYVKK